MNERPGSLNAVLTLSLLIVSGGWTGCEEPTPRPDPSSMTMSDLSLDHARPLDLSARDLSRSDLGERSFDMYVNLDRSVALDSDITDATPDATPNDMGDEMRRHVRAPCYLGTPVDTALSPPPSHCIELFERDPTRSSGCYLMRQPDGRDDAGYCWRQKALAFLVNNEIESDPHSDDLDGDGVIDRGELEGHNYPADPFEVSASEVAAQIKRDVHAYFAELSYNAVWIDLEVYWAGEGHSERQPPPPEETLAQERWYRLLQLRPGFAHLDFTRDLCRRRGGMSADDWRSYDWIMTIISHGTSTSGSQHRDEDLPVGAQCDELATVRGDYIVMKNFRGWHRLGTLYHEVMHTFSLDPLPEPSIGHSESVSPRTGERTEYGDLTDLMGRSRDQGHLSGPQKAFLKHLPPDMILTMGREDLSLSALIAPLEPAMRRVNEHRLLRVEVEMGNAYHVEVRGAIGSDAQLPEIFHRGALIKRARALTAANKSFIVDPTPETTSVNSSDYVLLPHRTFSDEENHLHISALERQDEGVVISVYRGSTSSQEPLINEVQIETRVNEAGDIEGWSLSVEARPGDATIPQEDLLYFWKLGPRLQLYTSDGYRYGQTLELSVDEEPEELWLLVSDRRGGERWLQVELSVD